jgi:hypothetical protein
MTRLVEQHCSPDGMLTLIVCQEDDGDVCVGFEGYSWHTHGDTLASLSGLREDDAVKQFVGDVINGRLCIAIARVAGRITDVWVVDEPVQDKFMPEDETLEFRSWDGRAIV